MKGMMTERERIIWMEAAEDDYPIWINKLIRILMWINHPRIFLGKVKA